MGNSFQAFNNSDQLCWSALTSAACASPPLGATLFAYDTRGNRTTSGANTLTYDQQNRLTSFPGTTYTYDGEGLRQSKTVSGVTTQDPQGIFRD